MRVDVQPIFERGRERSKPQRTSQPPTRGRLKVLEKRVQGLGRISTCANVVTVVDGLEKDVLPQLMDAELIWADDARLRIRGYEVVEGTVYGQTWDLKVL